MKKNNTKDIEIIPEDATILRAHDAFLAAHPFELLTAVARSLSLAATAARALDGRRYWITTTRSPEGAICHEVAAW